MQLCCHENIGQSTRKFTYRRNSEVPTDKPKRWQVLLGFFFVTLFSAYTLIKLARYWCPEWVMALFILFVVYVARDMWRKSRRE